MKTYQNPDRSSWEEILARPVFDATPLYDSVQVIIDDVKSGGDEVVRRYTRQFDNIDQKTFSVTGKEIEDAAGLVSDQLKSAIEEAERNIRKFHTRQLHCVSYFEETTPGVRCWQKTVPIEKVGLYIPGGSAPLLSTVLMLGIPAKMAGCEEIVLCTPPGKDGKIHPAILYVAGLIGISKIFSIGGVQAIAAMAHGTETVPSVNKIFGPGNQYVMAAKQLVSRDKVAIDMPAGPSELAVMADDTAVPAYVASDLLSQAEHGHDSQVILISDSQKMIDAVKDALEKQLEELPRKEIASVALSHSKMIFMESKLDMVDMINFYAPEHLIIAMEEYQLVAEQIRNVGSVFLGNFTPESAGDYASGTNHTLPTNGWARSYGGLTLDDFVKRISLQEISQYGLFNIGTAVMTMAEEEQLQAHRNAVSIRLKNGE